MADFSARIETMQDMFLYAHQLYTWCMTPDLTPLYSNCPAEHFFADFFTISNSSNVVKEHFMQSKLPIVVNDKLGIAWIAAGRFEGEALREVYLLGPAFTVEASEEYLNNLCAKMNLKHDLTDALLKQMALVPTIALGSTLNYGVMLYYCITGEQISNDQIITYIESVDDPSLTDKQWEGSTWHGTWLLECEMFERMKEGDLKGVNTVISRNTQGMVGTLSVNDPLRQAKNEALTLIILCSRASIIGGMSPEGGYNMSDYYIQRIEACNDTSSVYSCLGEMVEAFMRRVRLAKTRNAYSPVTAACMEYIETHVLEKINLNVMATELGYTPYYISRRFQAEVGESISTFTKRRKIEMAKLLLGTPQLSIAEISDRLSFSSPSYFTSVFHSFTGMTPKEYIEQKNKTE